MRAGAPFLLVLWALGACGAPIPIDVLVVEPCNQRVIAGIDVLELRPYGRGIETARLTAVRRVEDQASLPVEIPLAPDFQMEVLGYAGDTHRPPSAMGLSAVRDLTGEEAAVAIPVPIARIDAFHQTTPAAEPALCAELAAGRYGATATRLPGSGRVLIVGGLEAKGGPGELAPGPEVYDPETGAFTRLEVDDLALRRAFHTATLLTGDRVLIAGGQVPPTGRSTTLKTLRTAVVIDAEDPDRVRVSAEIRMREARTGHAAAQVSDGRVLIVGGRVLVATATRAEGHEYLGSLEIFDPEALAFSEAQGPAGRPATLRAPRFGHSVTAFETGVDVLIAGGFNADGPVRPIELVHLTPSGRLEAVTSSAATTEVGPIFHAASLVDGGRVLLSGGYGTIEEAEPRAGLPRNPRAAVEMWAYVPETKRLIETCEGTMAEARGYHTVATIGRRAVIIGGRGQDGTPTASAEIATMINGRECFDGAPALLRMATPRAQHSTVALGDSELLVIGGRRHDDARDQLGHSLTTAEILLLSPRP